MASALLAAGERSEAADAVVSREWLQARFKTGVLRWGGDAEGGAPYQLRDPQDPGRVIGFEVDLADALAAAISRRWQLPLRAEFVQYEWVSLDQGLEKGDFDCVISGFEVTTERARQLLFSRPYYIYTQQLVVRQGQQGIQSLEDCRSHAVGTLSGSSADRLLQAAGIRDIVGFTGQVEPYLDLELGRLDAVLLDSPIALYYAGSNPKLEFVGGAFAPGNYSIAVRPADSPLVTVFDQALAELFSSGRWAEVLRRWHLWNAQQAGLVREADAAGERSGLGFAADGSPLPAPPVTNAVDLQVIAASAQQWKFVDYAPLLVRAAGMTVFLSVASMALAMALGLGIAVARLYGPAPVRLAALVYVEFFRGIPLLLLLFFLYFGLAAYGLRLDAVPTAILAFGLNYAAYEAEIYRAAVLSVPSGQWHAGRALGMPETMIFRRIVLPQAIRTALPPMTNDFVALFKDTSLVSVIAVQELTKEYLVLSRSSLKFVELGLLTAALYLAMSVPLGFLSRWLEARWSTNKQ